MYKIYFTLICLFLMSRQISAQITIADARLQPVGATVNVQGIALNGSELGSTIYIDDATAGIALYSTTMLSSVKQGDRVNVSGTLNSYFNLLQLNVTSINILSSSNPLPTPIDLTVASGFNENYESRLVKIDDILFDTPGASFTGSTNYTMNDGTGAGKIRILGSTDLTGEIVPCGSTTVIGILSQYSTDYQLIPRSTGDLRTLEITQTNITSSGLTINYVTPDATPTFIEFGTTTSLGLSTSNPALTQNHSITLSGLAPATVYYIKITSGTYVSCIQPIITGSLSSGQIKCFFNNPIDASVAIQDNEATYLNYTFDDTIASYIDKAMLTLDIAIYNINDNPVLIGAINNAISRGVVVRMVFDQSVGASDIASLTLPASQIVYAPSSSFSYGIMHNKFVVIDRNSVSNSWVLTGSTNWTYQQLEDDKNNLILFQDQSMAKTYTMEFEEMFIDNKFGASKSNNTPHYFKVGGKPVEIWFSPSDGVQKQIKENIKTADFDIYFALMKFTRTDIANTLVDSVLIPRGIFATGIVNDTAASYVPYNDALSEMEDFLIYNGTLSNIFHHKYMLVDPNCADLDPIVWTGSHNWSQAANTKNDENSVVVHDLLIANKYFQEFTQRYKDLAGTHFNTQSCTVSIADALHQYSNLVLYPNPVTHSIFIQNDKANIEKIEIYNLQNQLLYTENAVNSSIKQIDLTDYLPQMYILKITTDHQVISRKIIKL